MRVILSSFAAALSLAWTVGASAQSQEPRGLAFLLGDWAATGGGTPGQAGGGFSFHAEAGGKVVVRRNVADYPGQAGRPAQHHEDLMVIYREGEWGRAVYWDNEGQMIHYSVSSPTPDEVVFLSDDPAGPRFRLTYRRTPTGLDGRFEIAPPSGRDQFRDYLSWKAERVR